MKSESLGKPDCREVRLQEISSLSGKCTHVKEVSGVDTLFSQKNIMEK